MNKKYIVLIVVVIGLVIAYYFVSPLLRTTVVDDPSPLTDPVATPMTPPAPTSSPTIGDIFETMDTTTRAKFDAAMEEAKTIVMPMMQERMPATAAIRLQGSFVPRAHEVEGRALLIEKDGQKTLRFEDFKTINGPNLHIYLSTSLDDADFIDLGKIRATEGNVNYPLDPSIDTSKYNKVLIWCVPFTVLFSYAELE